MNAVINSEPRTMSTQRGANSGCHLKIKLATSVSTTSLAVSIGGEVSVTLLIDAAYELFGFLLRPWVDVAQQTIQREHTGSDQVGRVLDGLCRHTIHLDHHSSVRADSEGGGPRRPRQ